MVVFLTFVHFIKRLPYDDGDNNQGLNYVFSNEGYFSQLNIIICTDRAKNHKCGLLHERDWLLQDGSF